MRTLIARSPSLGPQHVDDAIKESGIVVTERLMGDRARTRHSAEAVIVVWDGRNENILRVAGWARLRGLPRYVHMVER